MVRRWMWAGLVTTALGAGCGEGSPGQSEAAAVVAAPPRASEAAADGQAAKEKAAVSTAAPDAVAGLSDQSGFMGPGSGRAGAKQEEKAAAPTRDRYGVPGPREPAPQSDPAAPAKKLDADKGGKVADLPAAPPPPPTAASQTSPHGGARPVAGGGAQPAAVVTEEAAIDPNGRFATTYRPGGGHLSAFESAVAAGIVPVSEKEIVSDIGARYSPAIDPPKEGALALAVDFERTKLAPSGGPVHVRLALRSSTEKATERPPLSVVVVMDVSGSMRGQLIQAARSAASDLVDKLDPKDDFSLVTFSTGADVKIPMGKVGSRREELKRTIAAIAEGGGTNIGEGLRLGYQQANDKAASKDGVRVVFLMSDGRANEGITGRPQLARLALDAFQGGIQTSSFGMGTDYDGPLMSQIAQDGAGGYYYLRDAAQIPGALKTELEKRLDPVATAVEVRLRLKPGVELLNVYGSRRLNEEESARVRQTEVAQDSHTQKRDGIKANRQDDVEGGMRFFMPAFARDDSHAILLKLRLPEGVGPKDIALVELKYKDRLTKKNVVSEQPLKLEYANSDAESAKSIDQSVARTVQGFAAGEALMKAATLIGQNQNQRAIDLLGEREGLLHHAAFALDEPLFVDDAKRLARLRVHAAGKGSLKDPLVLAMMMETAGSVHLH